jgi:hypothetical protein
MEKMKLCSLLSIFCHITCERVFTNIAVAEAARETFLGTIEIRENQLLSSFRNSFIYRVYD